MTNAKYFYFVTEAAKYDDIMDYLDEHVKPHPDWEDNTYPNERIDELTAIYDATHRTIKDIAAAAGMSVRQLGMHFGIPRRTIEDWSSGAHPPAPYDLLLIQEALGLFDVKRG